MKTKYLLVFALSLPCFAQTLFLGPMTGPIPAAQCQAQPNQTGICMASDGVHVSVAGGAFGPALPAQGPQGVPGQNGVNGTNGMNGTNGTNATIQIGTVTSGAAPAVTNSGTSSNAVLNFVLQQGPPVAVAGQTITFSSFTCPKGTGTVQSGWTAKGCTGVIASIQ